MKEYDRIKRKEVADILSNVLSDIKETSFRGATFRQLDEWYSKIKTALNILTEDESNKGPEI